MKKFLCMILAALITMQAAAFAMTTNDFDNGMKKGINYFNNGMYVEAKDEFQWFCDANWGKMNTGQQEYALKYLDGTKEKCKQSQNKGKISTSEFDKGMAKGIEYFGKKMYYEARDEFTWFKNANYQRMNDGQKGYLDNYINGTDKRIKSLEENNTAETILRKYAKQNLHKIYDADKNQTFYNLRYLIADMTGDGINDIAAANVIDGVISYLQIYSYENGYVKLVCRYYSMGGGAEVYLTRYNGQPKLSIHGTAARYRNCKWIWGYKSGNAICEFYMDQKTDSEYNLINEYRAIKEYNLNNGEYSEMSTVSGDEYNKFANELEKNKLTPNDLISYDDL